MESCKAGGAGASIDSGEAGNVGGPQWVGATIVGNRQILVSSRTGSVRHRPKNRCNDKRPQKSQVDIRTFKGKEFMATDIDNYLSSLRFQPKIVIDAPAADREDGRCQP